MIVVFGSINLDLVTTVARIPAPGETALGHAYERVPGGKGANQALAARRAGAEVRLVGAVGRDDFAEAALALLRNAGVDLAGVSASALPTGAAFVTVEASGQNAITVAAGANGAAEASAIGVIGPHDILLLQREVPDAQSEAAARIAKEAGARIVLNLAPFGALAETFLALIDTLVLNQGEADALAASFGIEPGDGYGALARHLRTRFGADTVVTLGPAGAVGWEACAEHRAAAHPVAAIDTTGAGDSFVGAFAAALSEGRAFPEALARATRAASLACIRPGAQPSIPTRAEVDAAGSG